MARYGTFSYDTALYGAAGNLSSSGLLARVTDYDETTVRVVVPDRVGKDYLLVRSYNGAAEYPNEGYVISSGNISNSEFEYTDNATNSGAHLTPGWCYYTLFVLDDLAWVKDAATSVLIPLDRGTHKYLLENLPSIFTSENFNPLEPVDYDGTLARFLKGFALTFDEWAGHIDSLLPDSRNNEVVRRLDPTRAASIGMPNEYTIGTAAAHRLFKQAGYIYQNKGSIEGISSYVKALTGWDTSVYEGFNLILNLDDASFETGIGSWEIDGGTLTSTPVNGTTVIECDLYDSQTGPLYDFKREGVGRVVLSGVSAEILLPLDNVLLSIPVPHGSEVGDSFTFVVPVKAISGTPDVTVGIRYLDGEGALVDSLNGDTITTSSSWAEVTSTFEVVDGAKYVQLYIFVEGSATNSIDIDMLYFGETQSTFYYWDARSVDIVCNPVLVNQIMDPSIDDTTITYYQAHTGTVSIATDEHLSGTKSLKLVGSSSFLAYHLPTTVKTSEYYTLRIAAKGSGTLSSYIEWYDEDFTLISTSDDTSFSAPSDWTTNQLTILSPEDSVYGVVSFSGTGTIYIDTLVFANASHVEMFFSGALGDTEGADTNWYENPSASISTLYPSKPTKLSRLSDTIEYYLPLGVSWRVLLWGDSPVINNAVDFIPSTETMDELISRLAVLFLDADYSTSSQTVTNRGTGGSSLNATLGSSGSSDSNDPKWLEYEGTPYVYFPGAASNSCSVPNASNLQFTGDCTLIVKVNLDSVAPAGSSSRLAGKRQGTEAYEFSLKNSGVLEFQWRDSGTGSFRSLNSQDSLATAGVVAGADIWLAVTFDADNGASGCSARFWKSTDGISWTQIGTTHTISTVAAILTGTGLFEIGARNATNDPLAGRVYRVIAQSGFGAGGNPGSVGATTVLDVDMAVVTGSSTSFIATTGQTVTINRATSGRKTACVTESKWLFGTDDYMEVPDSPLLDFGASDDFTVLAVVRQWATPTNYQSWINKRDVVGGVAAGWGFNSVGTTNASQAYLGDGSTLKNTAGTGATTTSGAFAVMGFRVDRTAQTLGEFINGTLGSTVSLSGFGSMANSRNVYIGAGNYADGELVAAAVFRTALPLTLITMITDYYNKRA